MQTYMGVQCLGGQCRRSANCAAIGPSPGSEATCPLQKRCWMPEQLGPLPLGVKDLACSDCKVFVYIDDADCVSELLILIKSIFLYIYMFFFVFFVKIIKCFFVL